jgi:hypothetical protein
MHTMGLGSSKRGGSKMIPSLVYLIVAGIIISAFMTVKTTRDDRVAENEWIESEGNRFMKRIELEKNRKRG